MHMILLSDQTAARIAVEELDPIAAIMAAHRKAGEARNWRCRLCGERSALATCDKCLEENGW